MRRACRRAVKSWSLAEGASVTLRSPAAYHPPPLTPLSPPSGPRARGPSVCCPPPHHSLFISPLVSAISAPTRAMEATSPTQQPTAHGKRSGAARRKLRKERQAQLDAQFANLEIDPDKGPKLPPELVYYILDLASYIPPPALADQPRARQRRGFLRSASLVCRQWREEAQKLLWRDVTIHSDEGAQSFLLSPGQAHHTTELELQGKSALNGELAARVLLSCPHLVHLVMGNIDSLHPFTFYDLRLAGLQSLTLYSTIKYHKTPHPVPSSFRLPFFLLSLVVDIKWDRERCPSALVAALLESTITHAAICFNTRGGIENPPSSRPPTDPRPFPFLPQPNMLLRLSLIASVMRANGAILPFLKQCVKLELLELDSACSAVFAAVPSPLSVVLFLGVRLPTDDYQDQIDLLRHGYLSLSKARVIRVEGGGKSSGLARLKQECEARGITLDSGVKRTEVFMDL
ncbi:hypothetical protein BCR35DRAFT_310165 [Leucosporidium creatinivorum]|uniref:F-box domain-containing protein n=1 Tax=Leucosporidium creatinivorum TaxID=106004 RepID=A0A1Y2D7P2_9BASI|nr:hypothetical protein BCR35DRAFT_310165 [Leucosporidium creatinivorum]